MLFLAIDPGKAKTGTAILNNLGEVIHKGIVSSANIKEHVVSVLNQSAISCIVIGSTGSGTLLQKELQAIAGSINTIIIDEYNSTFEAKRMYWHENPPKGLLRFLPQGLRVPPCAVDDYAAVIIGQRYLSSLRH